MQSGRIKYVKMHGAGNDYVYIDAVSNPLDSDNLNLSALAVAISDRHFGVGGDGLVVILPSEKADFRMRMFNADGSEAQMCGNASRCIGRYVADSGLTGKSDVTLETLAGIKRLHLLRNPEGLVSSVRVDMGEPLLSPEDIPVIPDALAPAPGQSGISTVVLADGDTRLEAVAVGMGNPHGVLFTDDISDDMVLRHGPAFEKAPCWPEKANIEFVRITGPDSADVRVWERGSGETLACGTGACAALVAAAATGRLGRNAVLKLRGGNLAVCWDETTGHVFLTGDAVVVAAGEYFVGSYPKSNICSGKR